MPTPLPQNELPEAPNDLEWYRAADDEQWALKSQRWGVYYLLSEHDRNIQSLLEKANGIAPATEVARGGLPISAEKARKVLRKWLPTIIAARMEKKFDVYIPDVIIDGLLSALGMADNPQYFAKKIDPPKAEP